MTPRTGKIKSCYIVKRFQQR